MLDERHLLFYLYSYDIIQYIHYNTTYRLIAFFDILGRMLLILISHFIMQEFLLNIIYKYILFVLYVLYVVEEIKPEKLG